MRVCVTGATGQIGSALVRRLLASGATVQALARPSKRATTLESQGVRVFAGDVTNAAAVTQAVAGAELVFHLAANVNSTGTRADFLATNVQGTAGVLEAAAMAIGVRRVVHVSSVAVYGRVADGERIDETTPLDPFPALRDSYAHSKIEADRIAADAGRNTALGVTIVRPGIVYGPGSPPPAGLLAFSAGRTNFVFAGRGWHVPLIYIENLVDALIAAAQMPGSGLQEFNVVDDDYLTLGSYHEARNRIEKSHTLFLPHWPLLATAAVAGGVVSSFIPAAGGFTSYQLRRSLQDRFYGTAKIRKETGWSPRVALETALQNSLTKPS